MASLSEYVRATVSPRAYYEKVFPNIKWATGGVETGVGCVFHQERTPGRPLCLNPENGRWFCHSCQAGGKSIISFHSEHNKVSGKEAAEELFHQFVHPVIPDKAVRRWHRAYYSTPSVQTYVTKERHCSNDMVEKYRIGWTGDRITLPVFNEFGICVNAKLFSPLADQQGRPKMINYRRKDDERSYGSPAMLYPIDVMAWAKELGFVVICEGEWDALLLISLGIPAVTSTAGSKSWPKQYNELFRGLVVTIAYDNDKDGNKYDKRTVLKNVIDIARKVKRLTIPRLRMGDKVSKDVTDWYRIDRTMRTKEAWMTVIQQAPELADNPGQTIEKADTEVVPLDQASQSKWYNRRLTVDAIIAGKHSAPYMLPRRFRVSCNKGCDDCPLAEFDREFKEVRVDYADPRVLAMVGAETPKIRKELLSMCGMGQSKPACEVKLEVVETFNVEKLALIPTLESGTHQYVGRDVYYVGHGLHSNRAYRFEGITVPDPQDQTATHMLDMAKPAQDEIETFTLNNDMKKRLMVFRPKRLSLMAHLVSIADWQSRYITKIKQRPDLHILVDLTFHSVSGFEFNGEQVRRGMMDVLVIGDTRCGKGYVTEGISRYLGLGEIASGENCTFAGLIGGLQQVGGKRWIITWGIIPLSNNRLVVIDEASSLAESDIAHLSRVRSEGVAEINKIIRESTRANTRLIWLSNTRSGRGIVDGHNTGVEAIKELIGANEDISRFDLAMAVAKDEIPSEIINDPEPPEMGRDANRYPRDVCRALVLWAWSRRADQIKFSRAATDQIIRKAIEFGHTYSSTIPLVQSENIRLKIAKIAAAVAARTFSSDETGELVCVEQEHVDCACHFMRNCYDKPAMAYDRFSQTAVTSQTPANVGDAFKMMGEIKSHACNGLMQLHRITPDSLADYVGDHQLAKTLIGDLVKARCLSRIDSGGWYLKNPSFGVWLRDKRNWEHANGNGKAAHRNGTGRH